MNAPFETIESMRLKIEKIQNRSEKEKPILIEMFLTENYNENNFHVFCEALLQTNINILNPILNLILRNCISDQNRTALITLWKKHSEKSGLALYLLANNDPEANTNSQKKIQLLQQAAELKNADAMEQLYRDHFLQDPASASVKLGVDEQQAWSYLTQAMELGSIYCRLQVANIYLGKIKAFSKKVNLEKARAILFDAVPSYTGEIEYELFSLLRWGFYSDDFQHIAPDPTTAYTCLLTAAKKSLDYEARLTEYQREKELNQKRADQIPKNIRDCLLRIRNCKQQSQDQYTVVRYIKSFKVFFNLCNFLAFLLDQHFVYLPPFIFETLNTSIVKIQSQTAYKLENNFKEPSPLIESLFHPNSLAKLHFPNPHAEFRAHCAYILGSRIENDHIKYEHTHGSRIIPNPGLAEHYLRRAASNGHVTAQLRLGRNLLWKKETTEGIKFLVYAAEQYDSEALKDLVNYYWSIFKQDPKKYILLGQKAIHFHSMLLDSDHDHIYKKEDFHKKKEEFEKLIRDNKDPIPKGEYIVEESEKSEHASLLGRR